MSDSFIVIVIISIVAIVFILSSIKNKKINELPFVMRLHKIKEEMESKCSECKQEMDQLKNSDPNKVEVIRYKLDAYNAEKAKYVRMVDAAKRIAKKIGSESDTQAYNAKLEGVLKASGRDTLASLSQLQAIFAVRGESPFNQTVEQLIQAYKSNKTITPELFLDT